jgi:uncharacterized protein YcfL
MKKLVTLIICLLMFTACTSVNTNGIDTHDRTIPVYHTSF